MPQYSIYVLGQQHVSISNGQVLSGVTQGDGSHLTGQVITLTSNAWQPVLIDDNETDFADNDTGQTLVGAPTFLGVGANGNIVEAEYTLTVTAPNGREYTLIGFNIREGNTPNTYGTVEGLAFIGAFPPINVPLTVTGAAEGPGGTTTPATTYAVPCFTPEGMIRTATGHMRLGDLAAGTPIWTHEHGHQPLRQRLETTITAQTLAQSPELCPIAFAPDALGPGQPVRTMLVSPQHHLLIRGWRAQMFFGDEAVLVAAKDLVNDRTILRMPPAPDGQRYIHLVFDRHEIVEVDGVLSESFLPGPMGLGALTDAHRSEIERLFGTARTLPQSSHRALRRFESRLVQ